MQFSAKNVETSRSVNVGDDWSRGHWEQTPNAFSVPRATRLGIVPGARRQ